MAHLPGQESLGTKLGGYANFLLEASSFIPIVGGVYDYGRAAFNANAATGSDPPFVHELIPCFLYFDEDVLMADIDGYELTRATKADRQLDLASAVVHLEKPPRCWHGGGQLIRISFSTQRVRKWGIEGHKKKGASLRNR